MQNFSTMQATVSGKGEASAEKSKTSETKPVTKSAKARGKEKMKM
jgi:hypothetical protein